MSPAAPEQCDHPYNAILLISREKKHDLDACRRRLFRFLHKLAVAHGRGRAITVRYGMFFTQLHALHKPFQTVSRGIHVLIIQSTLAERRFTANYIPEKYVFVPDCGRTAGRERGKPGPPRDLRIPAGLRPNPGLYQTPIPFYDPATPHRPSLQR
jgi:hypothetical protein